MTTHQTLQTIMEFMFDRYGIALTPDEQAVFVLTISSLLTDAIDTEVYLSLRRNLGYRQSFTFN